MRKGLWTTLLVTLAMAGCAVQQAAIAPKGSWITASGNLDVLIAPCGEVYCGTVSKVLANNAMSAAGPSSAAPLAVGARLVSNLHADGDHWQGLIFNREDGRTYDCTMRLLADGTLEVRPYVGIPALGRTQIWRRAE